MQTHEILGVEFAALSRREVEDEVFAQFKSGEGGWIITANLEILRQATASRASKDLVDAATMVVADGVPVLWAGRLAGRALPGRVAGSDLIWTLSARAAAEGRSVYLVGGAQGSAAEAADRLRSASPGLEVAGWMCPPYGFEDSRQYVEEIRQRICRAKPDIVYVGLGFPKQELLIGALREAVPEAWFLGVGISIDFVSGRIDRAPAWMQHLGMEWLHRLLKEPRRLAVRYLWHGPGIAGRLLLWALNVRWNTGPRDS
jgi:N-acetylglucosaminyldiphosphoundecaprenol N-acetyl-beta-D-mannosaminyltransferase